MSLYVTSLILEAEQAIPDDGHYHIVRFPHAGESYDPWDMHRRDHPDGYRIENWTIDPRAGLIWPQVSGWATLTAMSFWRPASHTEIRDRFVRDPLNLATGYNSTATEDYAITPGGQYRHKTHQMFVHPGTSVAYLVKASGAPATLFHAQFKLAIEDDVAVPPTFPQ
jgi:hypothetical protein